MVDENLPFSEQDRALRYLFLDLNSYFASVEQQEHPELRRRPIAVCPVMADTSFVIAASYEAKAFGIRTGTQIGEAKRLCPEIELVSGQAKVYVAYHHRILEVLENVLPIEEVCSIDEMRFRLLGEERDPEEARKIAIRMKEALAREVGECLTASIGIAPNPYLAKIGTELQKPNGLVVLQKQDLPRALHKLKLTDFTGINVKTEARLNAHGIFTAEQLCAASRQELREAFGSILAESWWYALRGYEVPNKRRKNQSLGHSHVLPPRLRTDQGCREVILRLLQKAAARLRANDLWAEDLHIHVSAFERSWSARAKLPPSQDTTTFNEHFFKLWESRDFARPRSVGVTFTNLKPTAQVTPSLFDAAPARAELSHAIDSLNGKFGKNSVFLAAMEKVRDSADEKIAFQKTWLFSEGKGDNEWIDTFRGMPREEPEE